MVIPDRTPSPFSGPSSDTAKSSRAELFALGALQSLNEEALFAEVSAADAMLAHPRLQEIARGLLTLTGDFEGLKTFYAEYDDELVIAACHTLHPDRLAYPLDHAGLARAVRAQAPMFGALPLELQKEFRHAMRGEPAQSPRVHFGGTRLLAQRRAGRLVGLMLEPSGSFGAHMVGEQALDQVARFHAHLLLAGAPTDPIVIEATPATARLAQRIMTIVAAAGGPPRS